MADGKKVEPKNVPGTIQAATRQGVSPLSLMDAQQGAAKGDTAAMLYPSAVRRVKNPGLPQ